LQLADDDVIVWLDIQHHVMEDEDVTKLTYFKHFEMLKFLNLAKWWYEF